MPNYGIDVAYPPHPSVLERFSHLLRKIHLNWRAKMMIMKLSPDERLLMRRRIFTSEIFKGKKPYPISQKPLGNVLASDPVLSAKFTGESTRFLALTGDSKILLSAIVTKVNRKGKPQPRGFVLSEKVILFIYYFFSPSYSKIHKIKTNTCLFFFLFSSFTDLILNHLNQQNHLVQLKIFHIFHFLLKKILLSLFISNKLQTSLL